MQRSLVLWNVFTKSRHTRYVMPDDWLNKWGVTWQNNPLITSKAANPFGSCVKSCEVSNGTYYWTVALIFSYSRWVMPDHWPNKWGVTWQRTRPCHFKSFKPIWWHCSQWLWKSLKWNFCFVLLFRYSQSQFMLKYFESHCGYYSPFKSNTKRKFLCVLTYLNGQIPGNFPIFLSLTINIDSLHWTYKDILWSHTTKFCFHYRHY